MRTAEVIAIPSRAERRGRAARAAREQRRLDRATRERRRLDAAGRGHGAPPRPAPDARRRVGGRAWVNGREVGGAERRLAHLGRVHD